MKVWSTVFENHKIQVENKLFAGRLSIDGKLQDELIGCLISCRLTGSIKDKDHVYIVKVSIGGYWSNGCKIFVDDDLVYAS